MGGFFAWMRSRVLILLTFHDDLLLLNEAFSMVEIACLITLASATKNSFVPNVRPQRIMLVGPGIIREGPKDTTLTITALKEGSTAIIILEINNPYM
jgi:hypothetical protein